MDSIIVATQKELDAVPLDYDGVIIVKGLPEEQITIRHNYKNRIAVRSTSTVALFNECRVDVQGNSYILAFDHSEVMSAGHSIIKAFDNSYVFAGNDDTVYAGGHSIVEAHDDAHVIAYNYSQVRAYDYSTIIAYDRTNVEAYTGTSIYAYEDTNIMAYGNSKVVAYGNSSIEAWHGSNVAAWGNSQVLKGLRSKDDDGTILLHENARIISNPTNIEEWSSWYGIPIIDGKIKLYKAVHKIKGMYFADYNRDFEYVIGETVVADCLTTNNIEQCGHGIHLATKAYAFSYGEGWTDMAILELEVDASEVVVPLYNCWKVRAPKAKVLREVPISEIFKI